MDDVRGIQRGFTLLELLVVVSLIALLMSMLLPAFAVVRNAARNTACASNQRGIALAIHAYAIDNRGCLPYRNINTEWPNLAIDYLDEQYGYSGTMKNRRDAFHCPFAVSQITKVYMFGKRFSAHYGMNSHIRVSWNGAGYWSGKSSPPNPAYVPQPPIRIAALAADLVLLTDNMAWFGSQGYYFEDAVDYAGYGPWPVRLQGSTATVAPIIWHGKTINLMCIDGHGEAIKNTWDQNVMKSRFVTSASVL